MLCLFAALFYAGVAQLSSAMIKKAFGVLPANPNVISAGARVGATVGADIHPADARREHLFRQEGLARRIR
jgi:hypothetical protein